MKKSALELDPDADALLILKCPNLLQVSPARQKSDKAEPIQWYRTEEKSEYTKEVDEMVSLQPYDGNGNPNEVVFRVSSKHLCLASPVFRKMLKGNFIESKPNDDGLLEIETQDWEAWALLMILDIIHGHYLQVYKYPDLETVAQIALLVDYYDCFEVVTNFVDQWLWTLPGCVQHKWPIWYEVESQNSSSPFGENDVLHLFIAWSFRDTVPFKSLLNSAINRTYDAIETLLPIPHQILDKIEQQRTKLLEEPFRQLYNLRDDLLAGKVGCTPEYSSQVLGYLVKQMEDNDMPMVKPKHPFAGFSVASVVGCVKDIRTPTSLMGHHLDACKLETRIRLETDRPCIFKPGLNLATSNENIFSQPIIKDPTADYWA